MSDFGIIMIWHRYCWW